MPVSLTTPTTEQLADIVTTLGSWQRDGAPFQLHPGDLGWHARKGPADTAAALRVWARDGRTVAIGLLDGEDLLRMTCAPDLLADPVLARAIAGDIHDPGRGVLPAGPVYVEAPVGAALHHSLAHLGWEVGEEWTPLQLTLEQDVIDESRTLRIEVATDDLADEWLAVTTAAFQAPSASPTSATAPSPSQVQSPSPSLSTQALARWRAMVSSAAYEGARALVGYDEQNRPVAAICVWSAGPGRPGIIEPLGVHPDARGRGFGRSITLAGACELWRLGASNALVATPSNNVGAVATYLAAGFSELPHRRDLQRSA
ncbi:GNAT family N-acetyltransferase [Ornithinimicrobium sp. Y1694]|uniref:GNAT family N-acetyltransferase n=1 Tax=Ornithinimicrobium sp. Y1694 TaxID=3418590 RepID=UPI003CF45DCB